VPVLLQNCAFYITLMPTVCAGRFEPDMIGSLLSSRAVQSSSKEDSVDVDESTTLQNFLRMVSTQSSVIVERLESGNSLEEGQPASEVRLCLHSHDYKLKSVIQHTGCPISSNTLHPYVFTSGMFTVGHLYKHLSLLH